MDGFNTFEKQDKVLLGLNSGRDAAAALRILQQQGFAVQTFTAENAVTPAELLRLLADKAADLDCAFIATGHYARIEVDSEGLSRVLAAEDAEATRARCWPTCRRRYWPNSSCRWGISPKRMWRRCLQKQRNNERAPVRILKPHRRFAFWVRF